MLTGTSSSCRGVPERIVGGREVVAAGRPRGEGDAAEALLHRPLQLRHGHLDSGVRHLRDTDQARRVRGAEAVAQPAVVGADAGSVRLLVGALHESQHGALRRVEDLGVDAVGVHQLEPFGAVVAAGVDVLPVLLAGPLEVLRAAADAGDQSERRRRRALAVDPRVAAVPVIDQPRCLVEVLLLQPFLPQIGRLHGVGVGGNDAVLASVSLHGCFSSAWFQPAPGDPISPNRRARHE